MCVVQLQSIPLLLCYFSTSMQCFVVDGFREPHKRIVKKQLKTQMRNIQESETQKKLLKRLKTNVEIKL